MRAPHQPVQVAVLPTRDAFCDREAEIDRFQASWRTPGAKLVAYGDRRVGKTALLERAAADLHWPTVVVFSVATAIDPADAVNLLMAAVQSAIGRRWGTVIQDLARRRRLTVTLGPTSTVTGVPEFTLGLEPGGAQARAALLLARATWEDARAHGVPGDGHRALAQHLAESTDLHGRVWGQRSDRERRILRMLSREPDREPTSEAARRQHFFREWVIRATAADY